MIIRCPGACVGGFDDELTVVALRKAAVVARWVPQVGVDAPRTAVAVDRDVDLGVALVRATFPLADRDREAAVHDVIVALAAAYGVEEVASGLGADVGAIGPGGTQVRIESEDRP